jgi:hypothetical protein
VVLGAPGVAAVGGAVVGEHAVDGAARPVVIDAMPRTALVAAGVVILVVALITGLLWGSSGS